MGCVGAKQRAFKKLSALPQFLEWQRKFDALCITPSEVRRLYQTFASADMDGGGTIDLVELLTVVDVERTPFTERIFCIFDDDNSGKIDFGEFVLALWNYCTLSKVTLGMFAFDLYDRDSTGALEDYDLEKMMYDIYGKKAGTSHYAKQVLADVKELNAGGEVNLQRFLDFCRTHHSLLFPAFQMQLNLKKSLLGVAFWQRHAERRVKISKDKYIKIKDLLSLHVQNKLEAMQSQIQSAPGKVAVDSVGVKADRRRRSQTGSTLVEQAKQASAAASGGGGGGGVDLMYRDRVFNDGNASGRSDARHQRRSFDTPDVSTDTAERADGRAQRRSFDKEAGISEEGPQAPHRRKNVAAVAPGPDAATETRAGHNRSMPAMIVKAKPEPAGQVSRAEARANRPRGSAASFLINNTDNAVHRNGADQIAKIASHVAALEHATDAKGGAPTGLFGGPANNGHVRPKPSRRGSI